MTSLPMHGVTWAGAIAILIFTGCVFHDVRTQQAKIETFCRIDGVVSAGEATNPVLVGLVRHNGGALDDKKNWGLVDHFVLDSRAAGGFALLRVPTALSHSWISTPTASTNRGNRSCRSTRTNS